MPTTIWRLHTKTGSGNITQYCMENHVAAMGWSLFKHPNREELDHLTFDDYKRLVAEYQDDYEVDGSVIRLATQVEENDILWMHVGSSYYMARVKETSHWVFNNDPSAAENDACNQLTDIDWEFVGDKGEVPEALATAFNSRATFQRIHSPEVLEFSERTYNQKHPGGFHYGIPEES